MEYRYTLYHYDHVVAENLTEDEFVAELLGLGIPFQYIVEDTECGGYFILSDNTCWYEIEAVCA
jgi:hypothetical protein